MTCEDKVNLLRRLFQQLTNSGVLTWGSTANGYRWTCENHEVAQRLAKSVTEMILILKMDTDKFPYRFQPENGATVIFEPMDD